MSMNISTVMDGLGARLATITGLRVYDFPPDKIETPAGIVTFPEPLTYDSTMARGCDDADFVVWAIVSKVSDRNARDQLAAYMNGTGSKSIKAAIEADVSLGGAAQSCRVSEATVSTISFNGTDSYIGARFLVNVVA